MLLTMVEEAVPSVPESGEYERQVQLRMYDQGLKNCENVLPTLELEAISSCLEVFLKTLPSGQPRNEH